MTKKDECVKCKKYERKMNSPFVVYIEIEGFLIPGNN